MSAENFELTDFTAPVYLTFNQDKFWEIKLDETTNEVTVRCGKLDLGNEDISTLQTLSKAHKNLGEAITYMEKHVNLKLAKGYKQRKNESSNSQGSNRENPRSGAGGYSINVLPASADKDTYKRRRDEALDRDDFKQNKTSDDFGFMEIEEISGRSTFEEERKKSNRPPSQSDRNGSLSTAFTLSNDTNHNGSDDLANFKGEYLTFENHRGVQFLKVQVLRKHLKIEKGFEGKSATHEKEFSICMDSGDAITQAQIQIATHVSKGYKIVSQKFRYDFDESELNFGRGFLHDAPPSPRGRSASANSPRHNNNSNTRSNARSNVAQNSNFLGIGNDDSDEDYSDTSRNASFVGGSDEGDEDDGRTRNRSRTRGRSASAQRQTTHDDNDDDDDAISTVSAGDAPLGRPLNKDYRPVLLAHKWENQDPTGWYVSEKLDGVRCFWNGRTMWSRNGKQYFPPKFFTKDFPKSPLDGELWIGRNTFQKCVSVVRKQNPIDHEWKTVKYMVFDAPELNMPFKNRWKKMKEVFGQINSPYLQLTDHYICRDRKHLEDDLEKVQALTGEGLMIRDPESFYEGRRSKTLLKVKTFDDDEAVVIGHEPGSGKYRDMTGALRVRNTKGIEFSVGSGLNDDLRENPPRIGSTITYKHQGVSNRGVPRFPSFLRIYRGD